MSSVNIYAHPVDHSLDDSLHSVVSVFRFLPTSLGTTWTLYFSYQLQTSSTHACIVRLHVTWVIPSAILVYLFFPKHVTLVHHIVSLVVIL